MLRKHNPLPGLTLAVQLHYRHYNIDFISFYLSQGYPFLFNHPSTMNGKIWRDISRFLCLSFSIFERWIKASVWISVCLCHEQKVFLAILLYCTLYGTLLKFYLCVQYVSPSKSKYTSAIIIDKTLCQKMKT